MERDHTLYHGQETPAFTILSMFQITPAAARFAFDTFVSRDGFDAGDAPISRLRKDFEIATADLADDQTKTLAAIDKAVLDILGLGGRGYALENFYINTIDRVLEISAASEGDRRTDSQSGDTYDATIAASQKLVGEALTLAWTYGKENDLYLAGLTAV